MMALTELSPSSTATKTFGERCKVQPPAWKWKPPTVFSCAEGHCVDPRFFVFATYCTSGFGLATFGLFSVFGIYFRL